MWRCEYVGEDPLLFGREGWADVGDSDETVRVKFDGETEWGIFQRSEIDDIEHGR
jgi:hypothetical protein